MPGASSAGVSGGPLNAGFLSRILVDDNGGRSSGPAGNVIKTADGVQLDGSQAPGAAEADGAGFVQSEKSADALRQNMEANGEFATGDYQAHHIVLGASSNPLDVEAREILTMNEIDINAAENGVYAPGPGWHQTLHNNLYRQALLDDLRAAGSRDEVLGVLGSWKRAIVNDLTFNPATGNWGKW